jgi:hypothetical protein
MGFPLDESLTAVADANGDARVDIGPTSLAHTWLVSLATVASTSDTRSVAFLGTGGGSNLGGTTSGGQDTTDLPVVRLGTGQKISALWRLASPGSVCTLSVYGTVLVRGH